MAAEVELRIIKQTQETLGTVIKKPALNEKLLKKPPFRFLHDIISNVIKTTGFMEGLYSSNELNSENIKDKEGKIAFLQKAIDVVSMVTGESLSARPSKIVAGHEPDRTNEFLQALAKAIIGRMDSTQAVQKVLGKDAKPKASTKKEKTPTVVEAVKKDKAGSEATKRDKPGATSKNAKVTRTRSTERENAKNTSSTEKSKTDAKVSSRKDKPKPTGSSGSKPVNGTPSKGQVKASPKQEQTKSKVREEENIQETQLEPEELKIEEAPSANHIDNVSTNDSPVARPSTVSKSKRSKPQSDTTAPENKPVEPVSNTPSNESTHAENLQQRPGSSMRYIKSAMRTAKSARPTTARPAPPRIRNKNIVTDDDTARLASAKEVSSVILDAQQNDEDEGFVVEDPIVAPPEEAITPVVESKATVVTEDEQKGRLVQEMLDTKKDLEGGSQHKRVEIDKSQMSNRIKDRESGSREVEQLRSFIQTVSRSANPLGKMLDYLQEDVDAMHQELRMWREERQRNLVALRREESATESVLDPLRNQLEELEQTVQDQVDKINAMKATVIYNDERIQRMLGRQYGKSA